MARAGTTEEPEARPKPRTRAAKAAPPVEEAGGGETVSNGQRRTRTPMSDAHKEALALGRDEGRAVRLYLEAMEAVQPRRGRPRTAEGSQRKLGLIERQLEGRLDPLTRLTLTQRKMDIIREIDLLSDERDIAELEEAFIKAAAGYSKRKGITWAAWRMAGVSADVLRRAGITRTGV